MARTEITPTALTANAFIAEPAGTTIDSALVTAGVAIIGGAPLEEVVILVEHTAAAAHDLTIAVGDNPPADAAGQGVLLREYAIGSVTPVREWVGPLTSARFIQSGAEAGQLHVGFETGFTGTMWVYRVPRTA